MITMRYTVHFTPGKTWGQTLLVGCAAALLLLAFTAPVCTASQAPDEGWTIQIGSFSSQERADASFTNLSHTLPPGIAALLRVEHIPPYFAVRLGAFTDQPSAQALLATIHDTLPRATLLAASPKSERVLKGPSPTNTLLAPAPATPPQDYAPAASVPPAAPAMQVEPRAQDTPTAPAPAQGTLVADSPSYGLKNWQDSFINLLPAAMITLLLAALLIIIVRRAMVHNASCPADDGTPAPAKAPAGPKPAPRVPGSIPALTTEMEDILARNIGELSQAEGNLAALSAKARTIFVTSCFNGEGKTTAAVSMAHALTINGISKVLLIDGNPRTHRLHELYGTEDAPGLLQLIAGTAGVGEVVRETKYPHVYVMPFGEKNGARPNLLKDGRLRETMEMLREHYDYVLMDGHSAMASSDAVMVASCFEGTLLVVECERTKWEVVQMTSEKIRMVGGHVLGTILNRRRYYIPRLLYRIL